MRSGIPVFHILALLVPFFVASDAGALTLTVAPTTHGLGLHEDVIFEVSVFGLAPGGAPSLGAYDFKMQFDPELLVFNGTSFGDPVMGNQLALSWDSVAGFAADPASGVVNQFEVSLAPFEALDGLQGGSFVLAAMSFHTIGAGQGALKFSDVILADSRGNMLIPDSMENARFTIGVPDLTHTGFLSLAVLSTLVLLRRFQHYGKNPNHQVRSQA